MLIEIVIDLQFSQMKKKRKVVEDVAIEIWKKRAIHYDKMVHSCSPTTCDPVNEYDLMMRKRIPRKPSNHVDVFVCKYGKIHECGRTCDTYIVDKGIRICIATARELMTIDEAVDKREVFQDFYSPTNISKKKVTTDNEEEARRRNWFVQDILKKYKTVEGKRRFSFELSELEKEIVPTELKKKKKGTAVVKFLKRGGKSLSGDSRGDTIYGDMACLLISSGKTELNKRTSERLLRRIKKPPKVKKHIVYKTKRKETTEKETHFTNNSISYNENTTKQNSFIEELLLTLFSSNIKQRLFKEQFDTIKYIHDRKISKLASKTWCRRKYMSYERMKKAISWANAEKLNRTPAVKLSDLQRLKLKQMLKYNYYHYKNYVTEHMKSKRGLDFRKFCLAFVYLMKTGFRYGHFTTIPRWKLMWYLPDHHDLRHYTPLTGINLNDGIQEIMTITHNASIKGRIGQILK